MKPVYHYESYGMTNWSAPNFNPGQRGATGTVGFGKSPIAKRSASQELSDYVWDLGLCQLSDIPDLNNAEQCSPSSTFLSWHPERLHVLTFWCSPDGRLPLEAYSHRQLFPAGGYGFENAHRV